MKKTLRGGKSRARSRERPVVIVFGGGVTGLTAAHELSERGFDVKVIERRRTTFGARDCVVGGLAASQYWVNHGERRDFSSEAGVARGRRRAGTLETNQIVLEGPERLAFAPAEPRGPRRASVERATSAHPGRLYAAHPARLDLLGTSTSSRRDETGSDPDWTQDAVAIIHYAVWRLVNDVAGLPVCVTLAGRFMQAPDSVLREVESARAELRGAVGVQYHVLKSKLQDVFVKDGLELLAEVMDSRGYPHASKALRDAASGGARESWASVVAEVLGEINGRRNDPELTARLRELFQDAGGWDQCLDRLVELRTTYSMMEVASGAEIGFTPGEPKGTELVSAAPSSTDANENAVVVFSLGPGDRIYPGEHGHRFFPGFYRNLFDTMKRTPLVDYSGRATHRTAFDNLIPNTRVALDDASHSLTSLPRRPPRSFQDLRETMAVVRDYLHFDTRDMLRVSLRLTAFATMCQKRRDAEMEDLSWWDYIEGDRLSPRAREYVAAMPHALIAMDVHTDARMHCALFLHNFVDYLTDGRSTDMTLNGPTSEAWLEPWRRYLELSGVEFYEGTLEQLCEEGDSVVPVVAAGRVYDPKRDQHLSLATVRGMTREGRRRRLCSTDRPCYYVLAVDVASARRLVAPLGAPPDSAVGKLKQYALNPPHRTPRRDEPMRVMAGIQFYFAERLNLFDGHIFYADSPWSLTSISQTQYWRSSTPEDTSSFRTVLSVDVGQFDVRGINGKTAWECSHDELAEEVWRQIGESVDAGTRLPRYHAFHIDDGVQFDRFDRFAFKVIGSRKSEVSDEGLVTITYRDAAGPRRADATGAKPLRVQVGGVLRGELPDEWLPWGAILQLIDAEPSAAQASFALRAPRCCGLLIGAPAKRVGDLQWRAAGARMPRWRGGVAEFFTIGAPVRREPDAGLPSWDGAPAWTLEARSFKVTTSGRGAATIAQTFKLDLTVRSNGALDPPPGAAAECIAAAIEVVRGVCAGDPDWAARWTAEVRGVVEVLVSQNEAAYAALPWLDTCEVAAGPAHGLLDVGAGYVRYVPNRDFSGHDAFVIASRSRDPAQVVDDCLAGFARTSETDVVPRVREALRVCLSAQLNELGIVTLLDGIEPERRLSLLVRLVAAVTALRPTALSTSSRWARAKFIAEVARRTWRDVSVAVAAIEERLDELQAPAGEVDDDFKAYVETIAFFIHLVEEPAARTVVRVEVLDKYRPKALDARYFVDRRSGPSVGVPIRLQGRWRSNESDVSYAITQPPTRGRLAGTPPDLVYYPNFEPERGWGATDAELSSYAQASELHLNKVGTIATMYQVNPVGDFARRPGVLPTRDPPPPDPHHPAPRNREAHAHNFYKNLVLAGTYMKTYTRLTSMEAANESARHAVNVLLEQMRLERGGERFAEDCATYDLERDLMARAATFQPYDVEAAQALDQILFDRGLPHLFDIVKVFDWLDEGSGAGGGLDGLVAFFERAVRDAPLFAGRMGGADLSGVVRQVLSLVASWLRRP